MNIDERWERAIGLADLHGVVIELSFEPADQVEDFDASGSVTMRSGAGRISASSTTPEALRQLSAASLDLADRLEEARQ